MAIHDSVVYLCSGIPLVKNDDNTLTWVSASSQYNYFYGKRISDVVGTYQQYNDTVSFPALIDNVRNCNYLMYQNTNQSNKWYYCFIDDMEYENDSTTTVHITIDVWQTWYFDINWKSVFIEREHVTNDRIGAHTVPEGFDTGEYVVNTTQTVKEMTEDLLVIVACSVNLLDDTFPDVAGGTYGGVYSGVKYFYFRNLDALNNRIVELTDDGKVDAIKTIFMFPSYMSAFAFGEYGEVSNDTTTVYKTVSIDRPQSFKYNTSDWGSGSDTYTPKNNKLLSYPYVMITATNNQGQVNNYIPENFVAGGSGKCEFRIAGVVGESSKITMWPINYNGSMDNNDETPNIDNAISLPVFPQCTWNYDTFNAWFAQNGASWAINSASSALNIVTGVANTASGAFTGNLASVQGGLTASVSGVQGVVSSLVGLGEKMIAPASVNGNSGIGNTLIATNNNTFTIRSVTIKPEQARVIDNTMEIIGYKTNRTATPSLRTRPVHNYYKVVGTCIYGNIPQSHLIELNRDMNNGMQFWHNPDNVGNFSLNNH